MELETEVRYASCYDCGLCYTYEVTIHRGYSDSFHVSCSKCGEDMGYVRCDIGSPTLVSLSYVSDSAKAKAKLVVLPTKHIEISFDTNGELIFTDLN